MGQRPCSFISGNICFVVMGTGRPYMSPLNYCIQTKYLNKQTLLWNLCVLLTYIIQYCELFKFYVNNYSFLFPVYCRCSAGCGTPIMCLVPANLYMKLWTGNETS